MRPKGGYRGGYKMIPIDLNEIDLDEIGFIQPKKIVGKLINVNVLDKIKAEIADLADADAYGDYQQGFNFGLMRAAQIIDKYKAESEEV